MNLKRQKVKIKESRNSDKTIKQLLNELNWANVYHDSIRDNVSLQSLSLKVGDWSGNYSFFYLLHRIMKDFAPSKIVEFGLGESSKFISTYNTSLRNPFQHIAIEHDANWINLFQKSFNFNNISIQHHPLVTKTHEKHVYNGYNSLENVPLDGDFYLIDGPFGTARFSRYDIVTLAKQFERNKEFIICIDDFDRKGEQDTGKEILRVLSNINKDVRARKFEGTKTQLILASKKFRYVLDL